MKILLGRNEYYIYLIVDLMVFVKVIHFLITFSYFKAVDSHVLRSIPYITKMFNIGWDKSLIPSFLILFVMVPLAIISTYINRDHLKQPQGNNRLLITCSMFFLVPIWLITVVFLVIALLLSAGGGF